MMCQIKWVECRCYRYASEGKPNANMKSKLAFGQIIILVVMCALKNLEAAWLLTAEPRETILCSIMLYVGSRFADTNLLLYIFLKGNAAIGSFFRSLCPPYATQ